MTYGDAPREPIPREIDIHRELNRMEELVLDSPRVPLSRFALVDEERLLEQLDAIRLALPAILQNALNIVHQKDSILQETEQYAQEIIAAAERRAMEILDEMGLVRQAEREASQTRQQLQQECTVIREELLAEMDQIRRQAQQEADDLRQMAIAECQEIQQGADDYAEHVLHDMEQHLTAMLTVIRNGRQQLQGTDMDNTTRRLG
ncbi:MAG: hypothetical protein F6K09_11910 [Merismopedia sp. SIO2A8]|nr:hypothetical protein [Merismopedia sp. SIO2A8]